VTRAFLAKHVGDRLELIKGDFRDPGVHARLNSIGSIALAAVDCNLLSSIEAALDACLPKIVSGGMLFMDDLFVNMAKGRCETMECLEARAAAHGRRLMMYQTYPPCARAFLVF
jgi:hypothetical protein